MRLYLLPAPLTRKASAPTYPLWTEVARSLEYFFVERAARARSLLERAGISPRAELYEYDPAKGDWSWEAYKQVFGRRAPAGLLTEAGLPGVADPGWSVVRRAHAEGYTVLPLPGPSSITLALAASGLSGQRFTFWGYPPIEKKARKAFLRQVYTTARESTQILMETPARSPQLLEEILREAPRTLLLCVAHRLMEEEGFVRTYPVGQWPPIPLAKGPTLFLLGT